MNKKFCISFFQAVSAVIMAFLIQGAGNADNSATVLTIDCKIPHACSCNTHSYYAYAPSAVLSNGKIHVFYCSEGDKGAWDYIRYAQSSDNGQTWSSPQIVVMARGSRASVKSDYAACDPCLVHYKAPSDDRPYYYLFYSSAQTTKLGNQQTTIQVARSEGIVGPYKTLMKDGGWRDAVWNAGAAPPKGVPKTLVAAHFDVPGYGAGQPAVVVSKDKQGEPVLKMWYTDTTNYSGKHALIFVMESADPTKWPVPGSWPQEPPASGFPKYSPKESYGGDLTIAPVETNAYVSSVDVKWSSEVRKFLLYDYEDHNNQFAVRSSADGIEWSTPSIVARGQSREFYDGPGVLSDLGGRIHKDSGAAVFIGGGWNSKTQSHHPAFVAPDRAGLFRLNLLDASEGQSHRAE